MIPILRNTSGYDTVRLQAADFYILIDMQKPHPQWELLSSRHSFKNLTGFDLIALIALLAAVQYEIYWFHFTGSIKGG